MKPHFRFNRKRRCISISTKNCAKLPFRQKSKREWAEFTFMLPYIVIDFFLNNQPDALIIPILFCYKSLHVSGIFSVHQQKFSTVHSALVSFMQVSDDRFQSQDGVPSWLRLECAECTAKNSWWWTEKVPETCRVL